ncbi:MAG: hypothetical protein JW976_00960 [Syntrophaceae bacterium]|nr:hypothetical protein [Syntrophaceae bacterium]
MRLLLKPEISSWRIFNVGGEGIIGDFWLPPLIVLIALFLFYLEGRGKFRPIYHILLIGRHLVITGVFIYSSMQSNAKISFGTWGISPDFIWLVVPLAAFSILAIILVIQEIRGHSLVPTFKWNQLDWKAFGVAAILFPVTFIFFRFGEGFNWLVKIAVVVTIIQWILLSEAVGRPDFDAFKYSEK